MLDRVPSSLIFQNLFSKGGLGRIELSVGIRSIDRIFAMFRLSRRWWQGSNNQLAKLYVTLLDLVSNSLAFSGLFPERGLGELSTTAPPVFDLLR